MRTLQSLRQICEAVLNDAGMRPGDRLTPAHVLAIAAAVRDECAAAADEVAQQYRPILERGVIDRQAQAAQNGAMSSAAAIRMIE